MKKGKCLNTIFFDESGCLMTSVFEIMRFSLYMVVAVGKLTDRCIPYKSYVLGQIGLSEAV